MWRSLVVVMLLAVTAHADDDESKPVTYTVDGELGIHVDVTSMTMTGTYHWATKLDIHTAKATLLREQPDLEGSPQLPLIEKAFAAEKEPGLKSQLERMRATLLVSSSDRSKRLAAASELAGSNQSAVASLLQERLGAGGETDAEVRAALQRALDSVRARLAWG